MITFKARLTGIGSPETNKFFSKMTGGEDDKREMAYLGKDDILGWDVFSLSKNGKLVTKTIIKNTDNKKTYFADELISIFRILCKKDAMAVIHKSKKQRQKNEYNKYFEELDQQEKMNKKMPR